jgi:hypothetical protein
MAFIALIVLGTLVYLAFFRQTSCDVETRSHGGGCGDTAYGWLGACHRGQHKRIKRRALLTALKLRRPAPEEPARWARPPAGDRHSSPMPPPPSDRVTRPAYDCAMLVATVVGSVASLLALALQK